MKSLALLAGTLVLAGAASADSLFVTGFVANESHFVLTTFTGGTPGTNTQAGPMAATLNGTLNFNAYCVDSAHSPVIGSTYNVNLVALPDAGLTNSARISYLYQTFAGSVTTADQGAALQLAIWDVMVDNGDGLGAGSFRASSTTNVMSQAATDLSQSASHAGTATWYQGLPRGGSGQPQDLIGTTPVPEPTTILSLGAAAILAIRRKKRA